VSRGVKKYRELEYSSADLNIKRILASQRRTFLLVLLTLVFGIEIGFKLQEKQVHSYHPFILFSLKLIIPLSTV